MTEPEEPPQRPRQEPNWGKIGAIAAVIAIPVMVGIAFVQDLRQDRPQAVPAGSGVASVEARHPSEGPAAHEPAASDLVPGTCLTSESTAVDCGQGHPQEIVGTGECEADAALKYMGGSPDLDALSPDIIGTTLRTANHDMCVVSHRDQQVVGSLQNVLATEDGQRFRWCRTTSPGTAEVPCSEPHDEEILGRASPGTDCAAVVARYLDLPSMPMELNASIKTVDGAERCVVSATANQRLDATLRGIGSTSLPIPPS